MTVGVVVHVVYACVCACVCVALRTWLLDDEIGNNGKAGFGTAASTSVVGEKPVWGCVSAIRC